MDLYNQYPQFNKHNIFPKEQKRLRRKDIHLHIVYCQSVAELPAEPKSVTAQFFHEAQAFYLQWLGW